MPTGILDKVMQEEPAHGMNWSPETKEAFAKEIKKKAGGKKEKPLPGAKLPGMKDMSVEEMLVVLVQSGLVCTPEAMTINDFIGGIENGRPNISDMDKQVRTFLNRFHQLVNVLYFSTRIDTEAACA